MTAELATLVLNKVVDPKSSEGYVRLPLFSVFFRRHLYSSVPEAEVFRIHEDKWEPDH